jgi:hypothetical protein
MNTLYNYRPHAFQLMGHDTPVLSPDPVSLELVPFDQSPSLHPFRDGWLSRLVQRLRFSASLRSNANSASVWQRADFKTALSRSEVHGNYLE